MFGSKRKAFKVRRQNRRPFRSVVVGILVLLMVGGALSAIWYLTRLPSVTITEISVKGAETVSETDIRALVDRTLSGSYFGLIPYRFALLYPEEKITNALRSLPRVGEIALSRDNAALVISISERRSHLLWCSARAEGKETCYFVDTSGIAYEEAPELSGSAFMRFVTEGIVPKPGSELLTKDIRALLLGFAYTVGEKHNFKITRIEYSESKDATLYLMGGGRIMISTTEDINTAYANLASILSSKEFAHLRPGGFEYIDLRFGHKVFVQEEAPSSNEASASTTEEIPVE